MPDFVGKLKKKVIFTEKNLYFWKNWVKFICIAENFGSLKQQFTVFKLHYQKFFQRQNFLILEETERSSYLFLFCALQPSRYLPQEIKVIILASISNSECSDTGLFWLRMWVFSEMINGYYRWIQKIFSNRKWAEMHRTPQWYIKSMVWIKSNSNFTTTTWIWIFGPPYNSSLCTSDSYFR